MALFKLVRPGTWWVRSVSDPRWNARGTAASSVDRIPVQANAHVDACRRTLGEPPDDLEVGFGRLGGPWKLRQRWGRQKPRP